MVRYGAMNVAIDHPDDDVVRLTKACNALGHRIEHPLSISARTADNAQNLPRRGLFLKSFPEFRVALFELALPLGAWVLGSLLGAYR